MSNDLEELKAQDRELKRGKIVSETAKIPWKELQRYFAAGRTMLVDQQLDLVDVAYAVQVDDINRVTEWTGQQLMTLVSDDQARQWFDNDATLWAVVIKPWVLIQEISAAPPAGETLN